MPIGFVAGFTWTKDSRVLGFQLSTANANSDVYVWEAATNRVVPWVQNELGGIDASQIPAPELIKWKGFDGLDISGFLYPASKKFKGKRPVIIDVHGGPVMQSLPLFNNQANYFTNELGITVIYPNIRGSDGFGSKFTELDNGMKKEDAVKDIGALLNWIEGRPDLDSSRVMVKGGSYGAYMAYRTAISYNNKIKCAIMEFISPDLLSWNKRDTLYSQYFSAEYGDVSNPKMLAYLTSISPHNNADKIKAPIMIVLGKNDPRVDLHGPQQLAKAIRNKGGIVWYLLANDEGHGYIKQENEDYHFYATIAFIEKYLLD